MLPVKPFTMAKTRLATALPPREREQFAEMLFRHTIQIAMHVPELTGVLVVSRDTRILALARDYGAHTVLEDKHAPHNDATDLNAALRRGVQVAMMQGAQGVLILPADLPLLIEDDIHAILDLARYEGMMVIAPDRRDQGTNALFVTPPDVIEYAFGDGSFERHLDQAARLGIMAKVYRSERVQLDIDTPDDWHLYQATLTNPELG